MDRKRLLALLAPLVVYHIAQPKLSQEILAGLALNSTVSPRQWLGSEPRQKMETLITLTLLALPKRKLAGYFDLGLKHSCSGSACLGTKIL